MLEWLDGRNGSSFGDMAWNGSVLSFEIAVGGGANRLRAMLPNSATVGQLTGVTRDAILVPLTVRTVKGVEYAFFDALPGDYAATYAPDATPPVISAVSATPLPNGTATISWTTSETCDSRVDYGTSPALGSNVEQGSLVISHSIELTGLATNTTYYYRVTSRDAALNSATFPPDPPDPPAQFTMPALACLDDDLEEDFAAGTTGGATYVSATGDGEVILAPAAGAEFSGSSLPAGGRQSPTAVRTGGGRRRCRHDRRTSREHDRRAGLRAGAGLEFVATFTSAVNQHVGFGNTLNESPWASSRPAGDLRTPFAPAAGTEAHSMT